MDKLLEHCIYISGLELSIAITFYFRWRSTELFVVLSASYSVPGVGEGKTGPTRSAAGAQDEARLPGCEFCA